MQKYGGVELLTLLFLTSVLHGFEWSASRPGLFTPSTHIGGSVSCSVGLGEA
jgi:hypothetical protein